MLCSFIVNRPILYYRKMGWRDWSAGHVLPGGTCASTQVTSKPIADSDRRAFARTRDGASLGALSSAAVDLRCPRTPTSEPRGSDATLLSLTPIQVRTY